jgi:hypothetical protein
LVDSSSAAPQSRHGAKQSDGSAEFHRWDYRVNSADLIGCRLVGVSWAVDDLLLAILAPEDLLDPLLGATSMVTQNVM